MQEKIVSVGIIGFGLSSSVFHTPLLLSHGGFRILAVVSSRAAEVLQVLPGTKVVKDVDEMLLDAKIDLVINCAPNIYHYDYTRSALEKGKHCVVEKPFINRVSDGEDLINLANRVQRKLTVFHNRRWDSDFLTVKELIASEKLGEITQFESHFDRFRPIVRPDRWKEQNAEGSGIWVDLGSHLLDQALCLFGKPDKIFADIQAQRDPSSADDYFNVILKYGRKRVILQSSSFIEGTPRFTISGTKGHFVKFGLDPQEEQLKKGLVGSPQLGIENESIYGTLISYQNGVPSKTRVESKKGGYMEFYSQLHRAITNPTLPAPVPPAQALDVIRILQTAKESSKLERWLDV
jgi:scyllo-inositol 2-dehydrogenase (NADP+)